MSFFKRGVSTLKNISASSRVAPDAQKTFFLKKDESAEIIVAGFNLNDIPLCYVHSVYYPNVRDNIGINISSTCRTFDENGDPKQCRICNEMLFNRNVKRTLIVPFYVYDLRSFSVEGKTWSHTPKWWNLRKSEGMAFIDNITDKIARFKRAEGHVSGIVYKVSRHGQNAPGTGNHFDLKGQCDLPKFFAKSARVRWYVDSMANKGRTVDQATAIKEFFGLPDPEKVLAPCELKEEYLMQYIARIEGGHKTRESAAHAEPDDTFMVETFWGTDSDVSAPVLGAAPVQAQPETDLEDFGDLNYPGEI